MLNQQTLRRLGKRMMENLSAEEAEQYDRQIRLWGLDAQKRYCIDVKTGNLVNVVCFCID